MGRCSPSGARGGPRRQGQPGGGTLHPGRSGLVPPRLTASQHPGIPQPCSASLASELYPRRSPARSWHHLGAGPLGAGERHKRAAATLPLGSPCGSALPARLQSEPGCGEGSTAWDPEASLSQSPATVRAAWH